MTYFAELPAKGRTLILWNAVLFFFALLGIVGGMKMAVLSDNILWPSLVALSTGIILIQLALVLLAVWILKKQDALWHKQKNAPQMGQIQINAQRRAAKEKRRIEAIKRAKKKKQ